MWIDFSSQFNSELSPLIDEITEDCVVMYHYLFIIIIVQTLFEMDALRTYFV